MEVFNIYNLHYGIEERTQRKRHYAIKKLMESDILHYMNVISVEEITSKTVFLQKMKQLTKMVDDLFIIPLDLRKCYRNHIYPAEILDPSSCYYKANIRKIDAILIDRDPNPKIHRLHRAGGFILNNKFT